MDIHGNSRLDLPVAAQWALSLAAAGVLILGLASASCAANPDAQPEALHRQRTALYLQATRGPLENLEGDLNRLAFLSETCRVERGAQACGLSDKLLGTGNLEERYDYYVKQPVEAHSKPQDLRVRRGNWAGMAGSSGQPRAVTSDK